MILKTRRQTVTQKIHSSNIFVFSRLKTNTAVPQKIESIPMKNPVDSSCTPDVS